MSRKKRKMLKREIQPDLKYNSVLLMKFINKMMIGGKKRTSEKIVYKALDKLGDKLKLEPLEAFTKSLNLVSPATVGIPIQFP